MTVDNENLTPAELLETAERLYAIEDTKMYRAAILEAITALEAHVHARAFSALRAKLNEDLIEWLEEKTRMDFDTRLSVFVPLATGLRVDKKDRIWSDYKKAKKIRNEVTHSGSKVTKQQARSVINTVYEWIEYINQAQETQQRREDHGSKQLEILGRFIQASARLERVIYAAVQKNNPQEELSRRRAYPLEELFRLSLVDERVLQELNQLRSVRNQVVHAHPREKITVTEQQVSRLNEIVNSIEAKLR
jgi:hypothetical protein